MSKVYDYFTSPIGIISVVMDEGKIVNIDIIDKDIDEGLSKYKDLEQNKELCKDAIDELSEYFEGKRQEFTVPVHIDGTNFQKQVWDALKTIPYGETRSYKDVADHIGNPKAVRAIGQANRRNPVPIIVPCHRVIGKDGKMVGYAGSKIDIKEYLLNLETEEKIDE